MTDQTAYVEVLARLLCAADVHVHGDDHPTWQQLVGEPGGRIRDDYRKAARWLTARLTVPSQAPATDRAAVLREAADVAERVAIKRHEQHEVEREQGALDVMTQLRRMADEAQPAPHSCGNCDGVDPDTCLMNPDRKQPAAGAQQDGARS
jgi:hypothetical protein